MRREELKELIMECLEEYNVAQKGTPRKIKQTDLSKAGGVIYHAYPTKCPIKGRNISKGRKFYKKIEDAIKRYGASNIEGYILWYINDCVEHDVIIKGFEAFWNNLPEKSELTEKAGGYLKLLFMDEKDYSWDGYLWVDSDGDEVSALRMQMEYERWKSERY